MKHREKKSAGQRLISSLGRGLESLKRDQPLPITFVPIPPPPPEFRSRDLVELRARFQMTQAGMAAFLNVSEKTVESWEQGSRNPSGSVLRLLQVIADPSILKSTAQSSPTKRRHRSAPVARRAKVNPGA